jgi:hypothetical protein
MMYMMRSRVTCEKCMYPEEVDMKMEHIRKSDLKFEWPNAEDVSCTSVLRHMTMINRRIYVDIVARATERYRTLRDDGHDVLIVCYNLSDQHVSHLRDAYAALEKYRAESGVKLHCAVLHAKDPSAPSNRSPPLLHIGDAHALQTLCHQADRQHM